MGRQAHVKNQHRRLSASSPSPDFFHAASVCLEDSSIVKQCPSSSLGKDQTNECLYSSAIVPSEPSTSYCSCVLQLALLSCCPWRTNDMGVEKVNRDICSCPFLTNTISYSVTGDSVDSDSESEPKGGGVRGGFGLVYGGRQLWLKHCTLISWNDFSVSLLNEGGFAPQPVCCGLCVLHSKCFTTRR